MKELYTQFDNIFFEKTRLSIMTILYTEGEVSFKRLKKTLGGSDGAIYGHLQKLLNAKYISERKAIIGTTLQTVYALSSDGTELFKNYLEFLAKIIEKK